MYDFHSDKDRYFRMQKEVTEDAVIPFIESTSIQVDGKRVLEIGCAEAGVLKAFLDRKCVGIGIELSENRYETARKMLSNEISQARANIVNSDIYDVIDPENKFGGLFDIIILKDVIEHIHNQERFIPELKKFLAKDGVVFFGYPPWWMPFGGHQQICSNKILRTLPWFHLLPKAVYKLILKWGGESEGKIEDLLEIKETGITIERMKRILKSSEFEVVNEMYWFINPVYKLKFGFKKRRVWTVLTKIPFLRNFYTTAHYILFK